MRSKPIKAMGSVTLTSMLKKQGNDRYVAFITGVWNVTELINKIQFAKKLRRRIAFTVEVLFI